MWIPHIIRSIVIAAARSVSEAATGLAVLMVTS
jgi:hypothetical protein